MNIRVHPANDIVIGTDPGDDLVVVGHHVAVDHRNSRRDGLVHDTDRAGTVDRHEDDRVDRLAMRSSTCAICLSRYW